MKKTSLKIASPIWKKRPPLECVFEFRFFKEKKASPRGRFLIQSLKKRPPLDYVFGVFFLKKKKPPLEGVFGKRLS